MESPEAKDGLLPVERELDERVRWFVQLRWVAGGTVLALGNLLRYGLGWQVPLAVEGIGLGVLLYNAVFWWLVRRLEPQPAHQVAWSHVANLQINADLIALTALIYFTGGLHSPLLSFAVFHIMIASFLLRRCDVFLQAGLAMALVGAMSWATWREWLPNETLGGRIPSAAATHPTGFLLALLGFAALLTIGAYLASTIGSTLRQREWQVAQAQAALQNAYNQLEKLDEAKTRFTLMVTHEIRSPVAAVQTLLTVLRAGYAGNLPEQAQRLIERASQRADTLVELVNQLLDLARDRANLTPLRREKVLIASLLQQVEEAYRPHAEAKGIELSVALPAEPLTVQGDTDELGKLFSNLLSNAVKYTPPGGKVSLKTWQENGRVTVEVRDTGIGIPAAEQEHLFTEFFRASNAKRVAEHGTGLGLAIVKRIVDAHGGDIRFVSEEGKGTTFWVSLLEPAEGGDVVTHQ
ncbi:MAG: HAMP domain-containing sensor histidine kinase [Abditibacteriales bacterium]|nr:HAMP domain-containing sensor histidine kinase [Abditibacteriales bacterium]